MYGEKLNKVNTVIVSQHKVAEGTEWPGVGLSPIGHVVGYIEWRRPKSSWSTEAHQATSSSAGQYRSSFHSHVRYLIRISKCSWIRSNCTFICLFVFFTFRLDSAGSESCGRLWCLLYCCLYVLGNLYKPKKLTPLSWKSKKWIRFLNWTKQL